MALSTMRRLAYEVAAQFYAARGFETIADAYLRNARNCYDRWGAHGKVKQLDERYPRLREANETSCLLRPRLTRRSGSWTSRPS